MDHPSRNAIDNDPSTLWLTVPNVQQILDHTGSNKGEGEVSLGAIDSSVPLVLQKRVRGGP